MSLTSSTAIEIFVFLGNKFVGSRCFSQGSVIVGKGTEATLKINDPRLADKHAMLEVNDDRITIIANAGAQDVLVNGIPITAYECTIFDEIKVGPYRVKISLLAQNDDLNPDGFAADDVLTSHPLLIESRVPKNQPTAVPATVHAPAPAPASPADYEADDATFKSHPDGEFLLWGNSNSNQVDNEPTSINKWKPIVPAENKTAGLPDLAPDYSSTPRKKSSLEFYDETPTSKKEPTDFAKTPIFQASSSQANIEERAEKDITQLWGKENISEEGAQKSPPEQLTAFDYSVFTEEDEEDEPYFEAFSLLENIALNDAKSHLETEDFYGVALIRYSGKEFVDLHIVRPGQKIYLPKDKYPFLVVEPDGHANILVCEEDTGCVFLPKGKIRPLSDYCIADNLLDENSSRYVIELEKEKQIQINRSKGGSYLIRLVRPALAPKPDRNKKIDKSVWPSLGGSILVHILALLALTISLPQSELVASTETAGFAKIDDEELKKLVEMAKEPEPEPEPEKKPDKPEAAPVEKKMVSPEPTPKKVPRVKSTVPTIRMTRSEVRQQKQVASVLNVLEKIAPAGSAPGRSDLQAMTTNIAGVRVPGAAATYKIDGVVSKNAGGGLRMGRSGGGSGRDTKGGSQLLTGAGAGDIGKIVAAAGTGERIRGRVGKAVPRQIQSSGGVLDRAAIAQVVNQHMAEVQQCYEKQLMTNPGLAGKVVFDWTISPGGNVSSARQASSSLASPAVSQCILTLIKTWLFPKPVGGAVEVRFPFVFRSRNF